MSEGDALPMFGGERGEFLFSEHMVLVQWSAICRSTGDCSPGRLGFLCFGGVERLGHFGFELFVGVHPLRIERVGAVEQRFEVNRSLGIRFEDFRSGFGVRVRSGRIRRVLLRSGLCDYDFVASDRASPLLVLR